ncbi:MAG: DUF5683 domain-containing protein [Steroidobacteraceae bacterium]
MSRTVKAVLLSGLVLPGIGQLYLRRIWLGLVLVLASLAAAGYVVVTAMDTALAVVDRIEAGEVAMDVGAISSEVEQTSQATTRKSGIAIYSLLALWIAGIVDAYRAGRKQDSLADKDKA